MAKTLVERALTLQRAAETIIDRRDELLYKIRDKATKHAAAQDPTGNKYLKYRVPSTDLEIAVQGDVVTLTGTRSYNGGCEGETWTMPLAYVNGDGPIDQWLDELRAHEAAKEAAKAAAEQARKDRHERALFERLKAKFEGK